MIMMSMSKAMQYGRKGLLGRTQGFTLIELMIVVAVVAILAAIAYPSFQDQIRKSRRAQAKADITEYAALAERFHTTNNGYTEGGGFTLPNNSSPREVGATARYRLTLSNLTANTYTITATPIDSQSADRCGTLSINQAGVKSPTLAECW